MEITRNITFVIAAFVVLTVPAFVASAQTKACRYGQSYVAPTHLGEGVTLIDACAGSVDVATPADVKHLGDTDQQLIQQSQQQLQANLNRALVSGLADGEAKIKDSLKASLDQIPQRILTDAAKAEIKAAVIAEIKAQIDQLRQDMQTQIDKLKQQPPAPP